jgi:hypothetical protein
MLSFVPLHLSAQEREPLLQPWVNSWFPEGRGSWLTPFGWFTHGHRNGHHVWCPPPTAADTALEQLACAIHKRPFNFHVIVIPRLLTALWRKLFGKLCDLVFTMPVGCCVWPNLHHEPLLVGICLPLSCHSPWRLRDTPLLAHVARRLSDLPLNDFNWGGNILREFLCKARELESMSPCLARQVLFCT